MTQQALNEHERQFLETLKELAPRMTWGRLVVLVLGAWKDAKPFEAQILGPRYESEEGKKAQEEQNRKLFELMFSDRNFRRLTDREIADKLDEHIWPQANILTGEADLIGQLVERLQRAGGGPNPLPPETIE